MSEGCLLIVINDLGFFISHRLPIALAAKKSGYEVHLAYGELGNAIASDLEKQGFELYPVSIQRGGTNPFSDLRSIFLLWRLFRQVRPNLVHLITLKPVLYGGIAANLARVPAVVSAMTGLGFVFNDQKGLKAAFLRLAIKPLLRFAFKHPNQTLIFQNPDDRDRVLAIASVSSSQTKLIRGSGIDIAACACLPEPSGESIVVMASRLLHDKGVLEFVTAARCCVNVECLRGFG